MSKNTIAVTYVVFASVLEIISLRFFDCASYIENPLFSMMLLTLLFPALILIKSKKAKTILSFIFLFFHCIILLVFNYLFLANRTVFERSMLKQRNDAYATIEQIYLTKGLVIAVADLDKAIGLMFSDLRKKGLLDTTTIVLTADHNTYYNRLSNYAKKIETQYNSELYRVPMIIYDKKLTKAMEGANESREIDKFTTTSDVIPTILDLFGIPGYDTLHLGSTILNKEKESIIYSRAYNIFINDKFIGYSFNNLKYEDLEATAEDKDAFKARALEHLRKLQIIDKVFYSDYFSNYEYNP